MTSDASSIHSSGVASFGKTGVGVCLNRRQVENQFIEAHLFEDALALQERIQLIKAIPDIREDVVQAILRQIQTGTYQINVELLAQKIFPYLNLT